MSILKSNGPKCQFLQTTPLFSGLTQSEVSQLAPLFHLRIIPRNTTVFWEGDRCTSFYIVAAGRVRLFETAVSGEEQTLFILHSRDNFDVIALVDDKPHPVTAVAITDLRLYVIEKENMLTLLHSFPTMADMLLPQLSRMSRQLVRLVNDLSFGTVATRLARFILLYTEDEGVVTPQGIRLEWGLSHREIARFMGSAREVITRALHELEREDIIEGGRRHLLIKDLHRLEQAATPQSTKNSHR